jgi:citrate synthase
MDPQETKNIGLRGIVVADTMISGVDGEKGRLIYRGYDVRDLVENSTYEEVAYLLLHGSLPSPRELEKFLAALRAERALPSGVLRHLEGRERSAHSMDVLQSTIPLLVDYDEDAREESKEANLRKSIRLIARMATIVASWDRIRKGHEAVPPKEDLSHAANFLYMLHGTVPDPEIAKDFDVCLILHADHTFNASTFAAREVASTRAHIYASISAALGALSGELHGGANTRVMEMLQEIGSPEKAEAWVKARFEAGERIMGMGHAVYRTMDPRAVVLAEISRKLAEKRGETRWYEITERVREATEAEFRRRKGREIHPNVDFYSASVYHAMGIDPDLFTPVFAVSRIAGWCAHVIEEKFAEAQPKPALYRPRANYIGQYCGPSGCPYIPLEQRGKEA